MGLVCDIHWVCRCGQKNLAQAYDNGDAPEEGYGAKEVPFQYAINLKWNPPCTKCGDFKLKEHRPDTNISMELEYTKEYV